MHIKIMLLCKEFGRSHNNCLVSVFNCNQERYKGHYGLAAPHIPLNQPVHRMCRCHIPLYLAYHPLLRRCQGKRKELSESPCKLTRIDHWNPFLHGNPFMPQRHPQFQEKKLIKYKPPAGRRAASHQGANIFSIAGEVNILQRLPQRY